VFIDSNSSLPSELADQNNTQQPLPNGTTLHTYHIIYDAEKDF